MPLELDGQQRRELRVALLDAFPSWNNLNRMTSDQLDLRLAVVTSQAAALEDNAYDLIEWARAGGQLVALVSAARNQNPGNPRLEAFAETLSLSSARGIPAGILQKVVGTNATFLDVAKWRAQLTRSEWCVCRVDHDGEGMGTGFLVGPDLVLTNYHVVEALVQDPTQVHRWSCRFDHKLSEAGTVVFQGEVVPLAAAWCVDHAPYSSVDLVPDPKPGEPGEDELDFALLRLADPIGGRPIGKGEEAEPRGWIAIGRDGVDFGLQRTVAILQHPLARPMKLALSLDQVLTVAGAGRRVRHTVPTEPGSSGSPLFDGDWKLIALHHSGDPRLTNPTYNEAIPAALIAARAKVMAAVGP